MKQLLNRKIIMVTIIILLFVSTTATAQVPPNGKYNTTNYLEDWKAKKMKTGKALKNLLYFLV